MTRDIRTNAAVTVALKRLRISAQIDRSEAAERVSNLLVYCTYKQRTDWIYDAPAIFERGSHLARSRLSSCSPLHRRPFTARSRLPRVAVRRKRVFDKVFEM